MNKTDNFFDINIVLMAVYSSLENIMAQRNIELVYDIGTTIPKELKGNAEVLSHLLTQVLTFIFENTNKKEIVLSLLAPEDFLYEESVSFKIGKNDFSKEKIVKFSEDKLNENLEQLNGKIIVENEDPSEIHLSIPFKLNELGNRRYYRLPSDGMLNKKVLLICKNVKFAQSIEKMFKYFLYDVVVGIHEHKRQGNNMMQDDILLIDNKLVTEGLENLIIKVQKEVDFKYVLLQNSKDDKLENKDIKSAYLIKPVMQESIFELIISLFGNEIEKKKIKLIEKSIIINNLQNYIISTVKKEESMIEKIQEDQINYSSMKKDSLDKTDIKVPKSKKTILNIELGKKNCRKFALVYTTELKRFLESFEGSDVYFKQIVNNKLIWQIKEFCIDLEKYTKTIGAQSMSEFANSISLIFVYNKLDTLPMYVKKYNEEIKELIAEIKIYLR